MNKGCLIVLLVFIALVVLGAGGVLYFLWDKENSDPVSYRAESAVIMDIVSKSVATGAVEPRQEIEIKPQISGIIKEMYVEAGDTIREGDLLAKVKVIPNMVSLSNAENRVKRAEIGMDNTQRDYDRNKTLLDKGVIADADFQQFEIARRNAQEELNAAEDNLLIVKEGVAKSSGSSSNTLVRSTISGMVLDVPIKEGNSVIEANNFNDGTTIASVANMEDLIFLGNVDESEVEKLDRGMDLIVTIGAIEGRSFEAQLEYIAPKGALVNGAIQFEIKAAMKLAEDEFIRAGYSANADIVLDRRDGVLSMSESLVQYDKEQVSFVEVKVGDNKWERRDVELGLSDGINVEVLSGVSESDEIKLWNQPIKE
jgi:HlyD family secretion protein